jgi:hypothetical protein
MCRDTKFYKDCFKHSKVHRGEEKTERINSERVARKTEKGKKMAQKDNVEKEKKTKRRRCSLKT